MNDYATKIAQQIVQYQNQQIHDLPNFFHYWSDKFLAPRFRQVMNAEGVTDFYARNFSEGLSSGFGENLLSVGAGDAATEIEIAVSLLKRKFSSFTLECLELSPLLIERAKIAINQAGLSQYVQMRQCDINAWTPERKYVAIMANHSLHHFVELEHIFDSILAGLAPGGRFLTCDMIGRNGHMRWPEALGIIEAIWPRLPEKYKYNHQSHRFESLFVNYDCSNQGFEGIRAQDILKLLMDKFSFNRFLTYGGITEIFTERSFGPNFDPSNAQDCKFIDDVQAIEDALIDAERLSPTAMIAVLSAKRHDALAPAVWNSRTPEHCVREPEQTRPIPRLISSMPFGQTDSGIANLLQTLDMSQWGNARPYFRSGWSLPEPKGCWTVGADAELELPLSNEAGYDYLLSVNFVPYLSPVNPHQSLEVSVDGQSIAKWGVAGEVPMLESRSILIDKKLLKDKTQIGLGFRVAYPRIAGLDGSADIRPIGAFVTSMALQPIGYQQIT